MYVASNSRITVSNNFFSEIQAPYQKKSIYVNNLNAVEGENLSELDIQSSHAALESENTGSRADLLVEIGAEANIV